jgi:hypothetical protein
MGADPRLQERIDKPASVWLKAELVSTPHMGLVPAKIKVFQPLRGGFVAHFLHAEGMRKL